nr:integrase, catalytic region, zinc finger, CCHC-type, peptidase aspartic, catalytic [Tanacetum cinerariifolium]
MKLVLLRRLWWWWLWVVVLTAVVSVVAARGVVEKRRVRESGVEGRIDRVTRILFGFARKIPPEKFFGGEWWPAGCIFHQKTVPRTPQKNGIVERRNRTLVDAARTMLIFSKALMFLWEEATLRQISSGLVPNPVPAAPYIPPINKDLEILFQPMFDEYMEPPHVERLDSPAPAVQVPVNSTVESTLMEDNPVAPIDNNLGNGYDKRGTKSKQNQTKPSTKRKA